MPVDYLEEYVKKKEKPLINMIEITNKTIDKTQHEVFSILCDGFHPKGYVQMECRISDPEIEGNRFFIDVWDEDVIKNGHYSPLEMSKDELKQFIDYLNRVHKQMS